MLNKKKKKEKKKDAIKRTTFTVKNNGETKLVGWPTPQKGLIKGSLIIQQI